MAIGTVDQDEVARFSAMADDWWNPDGKFRPLHKFNPTRLTHLKSQICDRFNLDVNSSTPFDGLRFLDIGCGGGLISEPMARMGATVTGADASTANIEAARIHAERSGVAIDYRATTAEDLAAAGEKFDVVLNMEVVEHVADVDLFLSECARMVKPGGMMIVATLNRTLKAFGLAIVGAEYVLGWLPRGTHQWDKFIKPKELEDHLTGAGMTVTDRSGVVFNPLADQWKLSKDTDVNYMVTAVPVS